MFKKKEEKQLEKKPVGPNFSISSYTLPAKTEKEGFTAEDIRLIIDEWLKENHVRFKTRYTKKQVRGITKLQSVADRWKIKCLQDVLNEFRIAKLSEDGKSSQELVDILKERLTGIMEEKTNINKSTLGKFLD